MDHLKMYFLLSMVIFHCYVRLPEGNCRTFGELQWSYPKYRLVNDANEVNLDGVIDAEEFAEALLSSCSGQLHLGTDILMTYWV